MINLFFITIIGSISASAKPSCQEFFKDHHWQDTLQQIERLNNSEVLTDIILVQDTLFVQLIRTNQLGDLILLINERKRLNQSLVLFDEINLAVALGHNNIAMFLTNASTFPFAKTPLREDLLKTALFFENSEMFTFFTQQKNFSFATGKNRP